MKAMILAAGRGDRMRPLTDHTPKPLLKVQGTPLIEYTINQLACHGFSDIVINVSYLGEQIVNYLGNGQRLGVQIEYSFEPEGALETAGGILHALPMLDSSPFLVVNGDIACDFPLSDLMDHDFDLAHLVLIPNPPHHSEGDFHLAGNGVLAENGTGRYTFSGIGLYRPELFHEMSPGRHKLGPLLRKHMSNQHISGRLHEGFWMDIGTPERLSQLDHYYQQLTEI